MKMKQLLLSGFTLLTFIAVGQQRNEVQPANNIINSPASVDVADIDELPKTITCQDTVRYPQFKEQRVGSSTFYSFELWTDDNEEVSQKFELGGSNLDVSSVEFFGRLSPALHPSNGGPGTVSVEAAIYSVDGNNNPVTQLAAATIVISDTVWGYRYLNLATPLTVNSDYAVVIRPTSAGGIVQFYLNDIVTGQTYDEDLSRITSTYYDGSNGNWVSLVDFSNNSSQWTAGTIDCEALIAPIVSYSVDPNFTINPNPVCQDDQVTFTNTSASQDIIENRMYTYDVFQNYFGLFTADSTYIYDFGDGSNLAIAENTTHTYTSSGAFNVVQLNLGGVLRGCIDNVAIPLTVDPLDDATFTYSANEFCSDAANETPTTVNSGSFTAAPAGLVFANATTGEIDITASTPGVYDVTFTTNGTCPNSSTSSITISEPAEAGFSYSQASYCGDAGNISVALDAGATAGTFTATPTGLSITGATGDIDVNTSTAGNYTVTNTIAAANGCPAQTATFNLEIVVLDDASFAYSSSTLCSGGANEAPVFGGTGTFVSTPAGLNFVDANTGEIDMSTSTDGTYDITFTTNGTCPNSNTEIITITSAPDATFNYSNTEFCAVIGTEVPTFPTGSSAGSFSSTPAGLDLNVSNGTITLDGSAAGTYDVTNTIAASGSCPQVTSTQAITINALPNVDAGTNQEVCDGDQVTLSGAGADSYTWDNGVTDGVVFTPAIGTVTYTVTGTDATTGCENTDQVEVIVNEVPTVNAGADQEVCEGEEVTLTATASVGTVSWDNGVTDGTPFTPTATMTYTVTVDNNGCSSTDEAIVTVNTLPTVDAGTDETACANHDPLTLTGTPTGGTYSGTSVTGNEFDPGVGAGTYTVTYTYTDGNGCEASDDVIITVDGCASIDENDISEGITIMPNPATDYIDVVLEGTNTINSIQLLSAEGRVVKLSISTLNANTTRIDVSTAAKGTYFIQLNTLNGQITKKVILQ